MQSTIELKKLSRKEKLQMMEDIWQDLSADEEEIVSPAWHEEALEETERRLRLGKERMLDWSTAKKALRERLTLEPF